MSIQVVLEKIVHYLIDTNIIIYRLKNLGNVNANFLKNKDKHMSLSGISYGELVFGAKKSKAVEKNMETVNAIKSIFPLLEITSEIMNIFGEIKAYTQKIGKTIDDMDLLIAATAITNNFTLVTHNMKHFENIPNLKVEDWF